MSKKIFLLLISFISLNCFGDALKTYHDANIAYQKLDYAGSIKLYEQLIKENKLSHEIYYNLGNAYFKSGNFAKAILNYERASKFDPEDEDTNFNLKIAQLKVVDKMDAVPEIFYKRWINQLSTIIPANTWSVILILIVWLLFCSLAVYVTGRTVLAKKLSFILIIINIFLLSVTGVIAARSHAILVTDQKAIIMSSAVYVKSSPDEKGTDVFILHEGTKVEILDKLNNWDKVRIANGGVGWMRAEDLEVI